MGTSFDDFFWAVGSSSSIPNYLASGDGDSGFVALGASDTPRFNFGGAFSGKFYGVFGGAYFGGEVWPDVNSYSEMAGVMGTSPDSTGVAGTAFFGPGVYGHQGLAGEDQSSIPNGLSAGVVGTSTNWSGVIGWSTNWDGVVGVTYNGEAGVVGVGDLAPGVLGVSFGPGPTVPNTPNIAAVVGRSDTQHGVIGTTNTNVGVIGFSTNNIGVLGYTLKGPFAGYFIGNLGVTGAKAAVVPFPDGTHRALYCMESPDLWFEDFGEAKLVRGRAVVKLDPDFAKVIKTADYHVFLTPEGDCRGLYVRRKTAVSFEAREFVGGKSSVAFSYRIVGRRKDIRGHRRFAKIDTGLPQASEPRSTAAGLRAFVSRVEREARRRRPKVARKGRRSRQLPKPLRVVLPPRPRARTE
jgi:hypothetical protein